MQALEVVWGSASASWFETPGFAGLPTMRG